MTKTILFPRHVRDQKSARKKQIGEKKKMSEVPKTKAECEAAGGVWSEEEGVCTLTNSGTSGSNSVIPDADLMRENEMLKAKITLREKQLKQAIDIANKANQQQKAKEDAEKQSLISRIVLDSNNKFTPENLKDKTLSELHLMKTVLDTSLDQTFTSIAAYQAEADSRKKPLLTAGAWDSKKKSWVGGA